MLRLIGAGLLAAIALASCTNDETETSTGTPTCTDPPCDDTCADPPCDDTCADPPCDDTCADPPCDDTCADPPCDPVPLAFVHMPITIDDPIVNGTSLNTPVDGISYAFAGSEIITAFGRDFDDPTETFLWHLDESTATHTKKPLSGQAFAAGTDLCVGEDWCQLIGRDGTAWVVVGPAAPEMMRVSESYVASLSGVSGPQPPASLINYSHRYTSSELFVYGATGPAGFDDTLHVLTLTSGAWREAATGLPQVDENCLAHDPATGTVYSVAGRTTTDGGDTTETLATFVAIDVANGTFTTHDLPTPIGARQSMSCVFDRTRNLLYAFGGALVTDRFNDALNTFHNDLWAFDPATELWSNVIVETAGGTLAAPDQYGDQRFEGDPAGPNFGKSRGHLQIDVAGDRLLLIGAVPVFTHEQLYVLPLAGIDEIL